MDELLAQVRAPAQNIAPESDALQARSHPLSIEDVRRLYRRLRQIAEQNKRLAEVVACWSGILVDSCLRLEAACISPVPRAPETPGNPPAGTQLTSVDAGVGRRLSISPARASNLLSNCQSAMKAPLRRLITARPTTPRGILAKVAAAKQ
jgi:hypothetical protein